jgi:hypothetical protein
MDKLEWQCPFCTLINKGSSFKCRVCGTPRGTSTRQSKHSVVFEQQHLAEKFHKNIGTTSHKKKGRLKLLQNNKKQNRPW